MSFIKVGDVVINTAYIAVLKLENQTSSEKEEKVSLLIAAPRPPLLHREAVFQNPYRCEWFDFTGREAKALQDYFSSFNNVLDLLPQNYYHQPAGI